MEGLAVRHPALLIGRVILPNNPHTLTQGFILLPVVDAQDHALKPRHRLQIRGRHVTGQPFINGNGAVAVFRDRLVLSLNLG